MRPRDTLIISPQPLLILKRHRPAIPLLQVAHRVLLYRVLLQLLTLQPQASQRIIQLPLSRFALRIVALGRVLALLPTLDKFPQIIPRPTQLLEHAIVDFVLIQLIGKLIEHQVGLLVRILQVSRIALRRVARNRGLWINGTTRLPATARRTARLALLL